jgi:hypothetical protein
MKRLEFDLDDGGSFIRVPRSDNWSDRHSDSMTLVVYGKKPSGQWMQVEVRVSRRDIRHLAESMHEIIDLERMKTEELAAAMKGRQ